MSASAPARAQQRGGSGYSRGFRSWPRSARWATYVATTLVLVLVTALIAGVVVVRRSFPQTGGTIAVPGLGADVTVIRDGHGIPQVYAATAHDLFYAQGYVQAQDRFFEMDFRRHVTAGTLAELLGEPAVETDMYIRTMGWRRVAEQELSLLSPQTLAYLQAYSDGVNAYIHSHTPSQMSLEYSVLALNGLDYQPADWTPLDSVSWLMAMSWDLRVNMDDEIERAIASVTLSPQQVAQLFPPYPYDRHRPIVDQGGVVDGVFEQDAPPGAHSRKPARPPLSPRMVHALAALHAGLRSIPQLMGHGAGVGSNAWAVDGAHSTTGKPLLANDPHLSVSMPGIWYQMGLHCTRLTGRCPFDVSGFTFSGLPGVVIGHNQQIAWGFTNLGPDTLDLCLEKVRGDEYLYDGKWWPLTTRKETIKVFGHKPVRFTVRATPHGPLLSDVSAQLSTVGADAPTTKGAPPRGTGYAVAIEWTALKPNRTADALFEIDRATDWQQFRKGAADFATPAQNLVYADRAGNIGYQAPGLIPIRKSGNSGDYPSEGWLPADDWTGKYVPFQALPNVLNPPEGFVATANQAVIGPQYPYYLGDSWSYGYRSQRIVDLIKAKGRLSPADMSAIQLDTRNDFAPVFVSALERLQLPSSYFSAGQRLLRHWDFTQPTDSAAAAYYNAVWRDTLALTFHDQLPEAIWPDGGDRWWEVMRRLLAQPHSPWWDDVTTRGRVETRDDILSQALMDAQNEMVRTQSRYPTHWNWGQAHVMNLENQSLGQSDIGLVRWLFNRGGYHVAGGPDVVDATSWNAAEGYDVTVAPSMRMVVSLANLDKSTWVNLTGVSGHAFSAHYADQTDLYVRGETLPWPFTRRAVQQAADQTLVLKPARTG